MTIDLWCLGHFPDLHVIGMTVAYLKSGLCKKYTDMLNNTKNPLKPRYIIYTHPDGEKTRIDL